MNILLNINIGEKLLWVPTNIVVGPYKILNFLERIILPLNLNFSQLALPPLSFLLVVLLFPSLPLKYSKNIILCLSIFLEFHLILSLDISKKTVLFNSFISFLI